MQTFIFNKFRNLTLKKFLSILFVLGLVIGGVAYAGGKCTPCYINNYCQKGIMQSCPADRPVTMTTRTNSPDGCITCNERNGNETNPIFDPLVGDCVSCYEYNAETPIWNGSACVASSSCPSGTSLQDGVCKLTSKVNECEAGYIAISTADELAKIGVDNNYPLSGSYCLMNDISLSAYGKNYNNGEGWTPIGNYSVYDSATEEEKNNLNKEDYQFTGIFDGNRHEISDLYINRPSANYQGLFGYAYAEGPSGTIRNLGVVDVNVSGNGYVGALGGAVGNITNSYAQGVVIGSTGVGGLCGAGGNLQNVHADVNVLGTDGTAGGLVGGALGNISNSYATGTVTGSNYVGGLAGSAYGNISTSYATGVVTGTENIGGLIGIATGFLGGASYPITQSYSTGEVIGTKNVGGLVGNNLFKIENCYATGKVSGSENVGALVGMNNALVECGFIFVDSRCITVVNGQYECVKSELDKFKGTVQNSYATGLVSGQTKVGPIIGSNNCDSITCSELFDWEIPTGPATSICSSSSAVDSYFDKTTTGITSGTNGKSTAEMQTPSTYSGWDTTIWEFVQGQYPKLKGVGGQ